LITSSREASGGSVCSEVTICSEKGARNASWFSRAAKRIYR